MVVAHRHAGNASRTASRTRTYPGRRGGWANRSSCPRRGLPGCHGSLQRRRGSRRPCMRGHGPSARSGSTRRRAAYGAMHAPVTLPSPRDHAVPTEIAGRALTAGALPRLVESAAVTWPPEECEHAGSCAGRAVRRDLRTASPGLSAGASRLGVHTVNRVGARAARCAARAARDGSLARSAQPQWQPDEPGLHHLAVGDLREHQHRSRLSHHTAVLIRSAEHRRLRPGVPREDHQRGRCGRARVAAGLVQHGRARLQRPGHVRRSPRVLQRHGLRQRLARPGPAHSLG